MPKYEIIRVNEIRKATPCVYFYVLVYMSGVDGKIELLLEYDINTVHNRFFDFNGIDKNFNIQTYKHSRYSIDIISTFNEYSDAEKYFKQLVVLLNV